MGLRPLVPRSAGREAAASRVGVVTVLLFVGCAVLAAGNFVAVPFSNRELAPLWGAGLRFGLAAATFAALVPLLRVPWVRREHRRGAVVYGVFSFGAFYALSYWSLLHVTAGTASVVIGSVPLLTVLLAAGERVERLSARTLLGGAWLGALSRAGAPRAATAANVAPASQETGAPGAQGTEPGR